MAWEDVCQDKEYGGLGVVRLDTRNACMLLKLLHRLHRPEGSAWASWVRESVKLANLSDGLHGTHWDGLKDLSLLFDRSLGWK